MKIEVVGRSVSPKAENEDRVVTRVFDEAVFVALADGAGGQMGGARAAQIAVDVALEMAQITCDWRDRNKWVAFLHNADLDIQRDSEAGITTAIALGAGEDWIAGASVGDSEVWLLGASEVVDLTGRQRRKPFLGQGARAVAFNAPWQGETLLVGSDGLFKYASPETIAQIARGADLDAVAEALIERVRYASGVLPDDVSLVLARQ